MMGAGPKLISFPLFVMFMITLVFVVGEAGGSFTGSASAEFFGTREVDNYQVSLFDNFVQDSYDSYGENPNSVAIGGDWGLTELGNFGNTLLVMLDDEFGEEEGHYFIVQVLHEFMGTFYDENTNRIDNDAVRWHLELDPQSLAEWEELNAGSISFTDNLLFVGIFFGIVVLAGIVGIRIFGSGLSETSINFIVKLTLFLLLWGLLSIGAGGRLLSMPVIGLVIWSLLTFVYMMGVFLTLSDAGDE